MVIHALRDPKLLFIRQRATAIATWVTVDMTVMETVLPFIKPIAKAIKFGPILMYFLIAAFLLLVLYIALTTLVEK